MKSKALLVFLSLVFIESVALARLPGGSDMRGRTFRMREGQVKIKKALQAQQTQVQAILEASSVTK